MITRRQKLFWMILTGLITSLLMSVSICLLLIRIKYCSFNIPKPAAAPTSIIGLGFLALVLAMSVYLRQVASAADERQNEIRQNKIALYPPGSDQAKEKLGALNETHENLMAVAPFFVWLCLLTAIRVFAAEFSLFGFVHGAAWLLAGRIYNFVLIEWFTLAFALLSIFHFRASRRDERIRCNALAALGQESNKYQPRHAQEPA